MSYDIRFKAKVEGVDAYVDVWPVEANITWNVRKIIELSTGLPWINEKNNGLCMDVIQSIRKGRIELMTYPEKYKPYEAKNGYGTVKGTIRFFDAILQAWGDFVMEGNPELIGVATFWIV